MGREVRRVPKDWEHPKDEGGHYVPLLNGSYTEDARMWDEEKAKWDDGYVTDFKGGYKPKPEEYNDRPFEDWDGPRPEKESYMPEWPEEEKTHLMMYEDVSEGTPISPAFETPEELARWLADNGASACGDETATYEQWLSTIERGYAPGMVMEGGVIKSGVAGLSEGGLG